MSKGQLPVSTPSAKRGDRAQQPDSAVGKRHWLKRNGWERTCIGIWAVAAATATAFNLAWVQLLERQTQTLFFEVRGPIAPPKEVVILAIDETSLSQGGFYRADPQRYADLAPIQAWPWQRTAYATAIDKLMAAGAKTVAIDVILSAPSSYGSADDQQLAQTLQRHQDRVTLASQYSEIETPQGHMTQLATPLPEFCADATCTGFINFLLEPDGRIHRLGDQFLSQLFQNAPPTQAEVLERLPSFAEATLQESGLTYSPSSENSIFFYGPAQTFEQVPFWSVLDENTWQTNLQSGAYFKDKIVLIGSTAALHQDFHAAPFSKSWLYPQPMSGVEIHANAIATLLQGRSIAEAIPQAPLRGLIVFLGVAGTGWLLSRPKQPFQRLAWATGLAIAWLGVGYTLFVQGRLIVPAAIPAGAIVLSGLSQLVMGSVKEQLRKQQLRDTLKHYVTSPIVQEIISQQDDFQDLLRERELALSGKVLSGRYRIVRVLGSGGFSETYVAEDLQRPGHPLCVVKQLRVMSDDLNTLKLARRLFSTEAETLERLGQHDQIPQLLAHFQETQEFYLIQEFIEGHPLSKEISSKRSLPEIKVIQILYDVLDVLEFVHSQGVIHRDLKPSNIIRRRFDGRLVLIDFGVAKKITTELAESGETKFTVSVGTPGYMPSEQSAGRPQFNSDIYALGMMGIQALTRKPPHTLIHDAETGAVVWMNQAPDVSAELAAILNQMVHHDFTQRYRSVQEVKAALYPLVKPAQLPDIVFENLADVPPTDANSMTASAEPQTLTHLPDEFGEDETISLPEDETVSLPKNWMNS